MKLRRLVLHNFRPFYGTHQISFADGDKKNVTVIYGNNGSGKTAILNAFTWVLYEKFSKDFEFPDLIINKRAVSDAVDGTVVECFVELHFEHDGRDYRLVRKASATKNNGGALSSETRVELWDVSVPESPVLRSDGLGARDEISRILPIDLHKYFFFNGERIEQVVRPDKRAEISEATRVLLSVEILNRAKNHLVNARRELEKQWKSTGDSDTKRLLDEKERKEKEQDDLLQAQEEIETELGLQADLKDEVNQRLSDLKELGATLAERDLLETQQKRARGQLQQNELELRKCVSDKGYVVFLSNLTEHFTHMIDGLRRRGEIPAPFKSQFVRDLLAAKKCICGSELSHGSSEYASVAAWLERTSLENVEETAIRMGAKLEDVGQRITHFWQELDDKQSTIQLTKEGLSKVESQLSDIKEKLRTSPSEDIQGLQRRLDEIEQRITDKNIEKGQNKNRLETLEKEIKDLRDKIHKHELIEGKQSLARRRCDYADQAVECLSELIERLGEQFRIQLEQKLQGNFSRMVVYPYVPKLDSNYELSLVESTTGRDAPVPQSTGQSQVLCLAFIVSILDCVREWKSKNAFMGVDSTTFPMVIDSAFGGLDEINGRSVAKTIPGLVNQLVILVSKTQWRQEVSEELGHRVGRKFVLSYRTPKKDAPTDSITLDGNDYELVAHSPDNFDYTDLIEL